MDEEITLMLIKDLYPLGPHTSYCESADTVASAMARYVTAERLATMDPDLRDVVRTAGEWKGELKPHQGWLSKMKGESPPEAAGREEFLSAIRHAVRLRQLVDGNGYWSGP